MEDARLLLEVASEMKGLGKRTERDEEEEDGGFQKRSKRDEFAEERDLVDGMKEEMQKRGIRVFPDTHCIIWAREAMLHLLTNETGDSYAAVFSNYLCRMWKARYFLAINALSWTNSEVEKDAEQLKDWIKETKPKPFRLLSVLFMITFPGKKPNWYYAPLITMMVVPQRSSWTLSQNTDFLHWVQQLKEYMGGLDKNSVFQKAVMCSPVFDSRSLKRTVRFCLRYGADKDLMISLLECPFSRDDPMHLWPDFLDKKYDTEEKQKAMLEKLSSDETLEKIKNSLPAFVYDF